MQQALSQVSEIIQAQAFQDSGRTGNQQTYVDCGKNGEQLAHLLLEEEADAGLLAGPQVQERRNRSVRPISTICSIERSDQVSGNFQFEEINSPA
jgi:hypothetical protein